MNKLRTFTITKLERNRMSFFSQEDSSLQSDINCQIFHVDYMGDNTYKVFANDPTRNNCYLYACTFKADGFVTPEKVWEAYLCTHRPADPSSR